MLASLGRTKVLARRRSTRAGTTGLLNAQGSAFDDLALKAFLGSIGLLSSNHLNKAKATGFLGVRVKHDLAFLNLTIFLEQTGYFDLG
jgi:hypothetical protein